MPGFLADPVFWLAVLLWTGLLVFAVCLCSANTRAQRRSRTDVGERERRRREALNRAATSRSLLDRLAVLERERRELLDRIAKRSRISGGSGWRRL